jgi:hypothetical protein
MSENPAKEPLRLDALLVRQVAELVAATAEMAANNESLDYQIHLFRTLAENCRWKADALLELKAEFEKAAKAEEAAA